MNHALSGFISSSCSCLLLQPLDLIKTRSQQFPSFSYLHLLKGIWKEDGIRGFWRGSAVSLIRIALGSSAYFTILAKSKDFMLEKSILSRNESLNEQGNFVLGAFSRASAGLVNMPFTVLKTRFESSQFASYRGIGKALMEIGKSEGFSGLFRGYFWCIARDAPQSGLFLVAYRKIQHNFADKLQLQNTLTNAISAFLASSFACSITQPFDVAKTQIQLQKRTTNEHALRMYFSKNGFRAFFKGLTPRIARKSLSSAITWSIYEKLASFDLESSEANKRA